MEKPMKVGAIYRVHKGTERAINYVDVMYLENDIFKVINPVGNGVSNHKPNSVLAGASDYPSPKLLANSLEEYTVLVEPSVQVRVQYYDDTIIDKLYNWYCKLLKRDLYV